jgi:hypothetical protein
MRCKMLTSVLKKKQQLPHRTTVKQHDGYTDKPSECFGGARIRPCAAASSRNRCEGGRRASQSHTGKSPHRQSRARRARTPHRRDCSCQRSLAARGEHGHAHLLGVLSSPFRACAPLSSAHAARGRSVYPAGVTQSVVPHDVCLEWRNLCQEWARAGERRRRQLHELHAVERCVSCDFI